MVVAVTRISECSTLPVQRTTSPSKRPLNDVYVEALPRLEWSLAIEEPPVPEAAGPASLRRGWIHRAAEEQVLSLFRKLNPTHPALPAPWWLSALDRGDIPSRSAAYAVEDEVHTVLSTRTGWVFVPWASAGESGYWEYGPSDRHPRSMPTTVVMTSRHQGWVNVVPAHAGTSPAPMQITGAAGLASKLEEIESW